MGKKLNELSLLDLAVATVGTESRAGFASPEAKAFRGEVSRRATSDPNVSAYLDRARRFAASIAEGCTMEFFHGAGFSLADRKLALALGAKKRRPRFTKGTLSLRGGNLGRALARKSNR
jgi:hypothetical protein